MQGSSHMRKGDARSVEPERRRRDSIPAIQAPRRGHAGPVEAGRSHGAAALTGKAPELFAEPPAIERVDIVAAKLP